MEVIALLLLVWLLVVLVKKGKHRIIGSEVVQSQATAPICFVYVMELTYKDGRHTKRIVKPGIGTENRIRQHKQRGWRLIHTESFSDRTTAESVENNVLHRIRTTRTRPVPELAKAMMFQGGGSEVTTLPATQVKKWVMEEAKRARRRRPRT